MSVILNPYRYAGAGGFSPLDISGCDIWLDGSDISTMYDSTIGGSLVANGGAIKRWEDKSGNARHAIEANSSFLPERRDAGWTNGQTCIGPDNNGWILKFSPELDMRVYANVTVFFVSTYNSSYYANGLLGGGVLNTVQVLSTGVRVSRQSVLVSPIFYSVGDKNIITTHFSGNLTSIYQEGVLTAGPTDLGNWDTWNQAQRLGLMQYYARKGEFGEFIVYNSALSDADRKAVEAYLGEKWGVTITH